MISRFFIDRPIFASVLSIFLTLAGAICVFALPIAQYPDVVPPTVQVSVNYPGASAQVVADTVAAPIEQQVNGVENMLYMSSTSDNTGYYNLTVTFDLGTDLNTALVTVQNRVNLAVPQLPQAVQKQGLTIKKKSPNIMLVINLISPKGRYDDLYLSNYATIHVKDEIFRLEGVGDIAYLGQRDYSIRIWLDPEKLAALDMSATEMVKALQNQNIPLASGQLGQQPAPSGQTFTLPTDALGRLKTTEQFGDVIVRSDPGGPNGEASRFVRMRDVARIELGAQKYDQSAFFDNLQSVALAVYQLPGSNALDVAERVYNKMKELEKRFPQDLEYRIVYDTTPFIKESVVDVVKTLRDAIILVAIVVLVFLQSWRPTIIPLVAVPVAIVGTFVVMAGLGFSINNISLFGLVLAIGIVVDDAIVVVENVERWLEQGLSPREAARKAMDEVTGPVVAVALVLCAVFVPCAFIAGITGQFFRQFALTIAVSTVFSAINSLTLSPALAAILLKPRRHGETNRGGLLSLGFSLFNSAFNVSTRAYSAVVGGLLRMCVLVLVCYGGLLVLTGWFFGKVPTGFIPLQDQGWLLINIQLPDSSSVQRTQEVLKQVDAIARADKGVAHTVSVAGQSVLLSVMGSNYASMFVVLKPFDERRHAELSGFRILFRLRQQCRDKVREGVINVFPPPPINGLGTAGGFKLLVEDRNSLGAQFLGEEADKLLAEARKDHRLAGMMTMFRANTPQLYAEPDRTHAKTMGLSIKDVNDTLQIYMGSMYVNNINLFGRFWQVNVMADLPFRNRVEDIGQLKVRNKTGKMVPLGAVLDVRDVLGPAMILRYNLYESAPINGGTMPGVSSGDAIRIMDAISKDTLARSIKTEWTELTYLQIKAGNTAMFVFALAVVFVFLVLAALYESWSLPLAVILVVPMCLLCSVIGVAVVRSDINIFTQIGFVVLVGLASKNAILIVEFAKQLREEGQDLFVATTEACRLRLRPIMMTSFAFIFGVVPLVLAAGAGAEMRRALGIAVFSGMLGVTLFGVLLTPVFFYVIQRLGETRLLSGERVQRIGSLILGGALALVLCLLFMAVRMPFRWALPAGLLAGMLTAALVARVKRRLRKTKAAG